MPLNTLSWGTMAWSALKSANTIEAGMGSVLLATATVTETSRPTAVRRWGPARIGLKLPAGASGQVELRMNGLGGNGCPVATGQASDC